MLSLSSEKRQCNTVNAISKPNAVPSPTGKEPPLPLTSTHVWKVADRGTCGLPTQRPTWQLPWARWESWAGAPSDLGEGEFVQPPGLFDLQLEGVFVGVMLHDVVVHVHQDPARGEPRQTHSVLPALPAGPAFTVSSAPYSLGCGRRLLKPPYASTSSSTKRLLTIVPTL